MEEKKEVEKKKCSGWVEYWYGCGAITLAIVGYMLFSGQNVYANALLDYSTIADALSSEITGAVPAFVAVIGLVIGIPLALRLVKRIIR